MRPNPLRLLFLILPLAVLAGCKSPTPCGGNSEYLAAVERPPLQLPPEITPTERMQPLVIPAADPNPTVLDPVPRCLDQPPRFFARKGAVADPAEEVVRAWAALRPLPSTPALAAGAVETLRLTLMSTLVADLSFSGGLSE